MAGAGLGTAGLLEQVKGSVGNTETATQAGEAAITGLSSAQGAIADNRQLNAEIALSNQEIVAKLLVADLAAQTEIDVATLQAEAAKSAASSSSAGSIIGSIIGAAAILA